MERIKRCLDIEFRSSEEDDRTIEGYASVFDQETDIGWFFEKIDRHAFDNCDMSNVYLLMNHDDNIVLAGTPNNSLELSVDDKGLRIKAKVVDTSQGNDYLKLVKEGLIRKMSFGFTIDRDHGCEWYEDADGNDHRTILSINKLYDASIVTFPAYEGTSVRSADELDEDAKKHLEERKVNKEKELRAEEVAEEVIEEVVEEVVEPTEENVEETTATEEVETNVEENHEEKSQVVQMEERNMNTNFENVQARVEDITAWRKSVMTSIMEERAGVKSTDTGVPVPTIFQNYIEKAWEKIELLDEVSVTAVKGIFKSSYEVEADGANYHAEGASAPNEESLTLATITLIPRMVKKWISVTDELEAMTDEEFMKYIADEVVYQVLKFVQDKILVGAGQGTGSNEGLVGIVNATLTESLTTELDFNIANKALAIVDGGSEPLAVMNRATFFNGIMGLKDTTGAPIFQIATDNTGRPQYFVNGIRAKFSNALPAYDTADEGDVYAIIGDFKAYRLNMPNGRNVQTLFDPYTLATQDMSRMIGKLFVAGNVCKPKALVKLVKPTAE